MARDAEALLLQVSADVRGLEKQFAKAQGIVNSGSKAMERRAQTASTTLERFFGKTDPAKALDKVFDATRFKVLDTGVAKVGLMGSALESLGPAGLVAAAAVGAVGAAFAGAREAARFADDIADTANRLHVTTDALQEYRYAIRAAGGEEKGADEALEGFSVTLGKAQQGLAKSQRAFISLGFTKDQIKSFKDVDEALRAVTDKIGGLGKNAQKDAIISQLGLDGLKPLLQGGVAEMERLRQEAHKLGIVMDADLVKRGGDLNDEFETVAQVINVQLKSALVDLGPVLVGILRQMAELAKVAAEVADAFRDIEHKRQSRLKTLGDDFEARSKTPLTYAYGGPAKDRERAARARAAYAKSVAENAAPGAPPAGRNLIDTTRTPKAPSGPRDDTAQRVEQTSSAVAGANRDLLQAQQGLTENITERAANERAMIDEELAQAIARLNKQKADLDSDKGISVATRATLKAKLDEAEATTRKAAEAKADLVNREADWAAEDAADDIRTRLRDFQIAQMQVQADLATTAEERNRIEADILKLKQDELIHERNKGLSRQVLTGAMTQEDADKLQTASAGDLAAARQSDAAGRAGPVESYLRSIQDLNTEFQTAGVQAIGALSDGLTQAILGAESLGDVAKNVFRQLAADFLAASIRKTIAGPIAAMFGFKIPGFASGTNSAPGGAAWVGEKGPELVNLPRGAQVLPNNLLQSLANMKASPGMTTVHQTITLDNRGALIWENEAAKLMSYANQAASRAGYGAVQTARQQTRADLTRRARTAL